jgi:hypothetical protein
MFAQTHWFRLRTVKRDIAPACWQGWVYLVLWGAVTALPAMLLLIRGQGWEAATWLVVMTGVLFYEIWQVRRALVGGCSHVASSRNIPTATMVAEPQSHDDGIYFLDQQQGAKPVNTARFQLSLKQ